MLSASEPIKPYQAICRLHLVTFHPDARHGRSIRGSKGRHPQGQLYAVSRIRSQHEVCTTKASHSRRLMLAPPDKRCNITFGRTASITSCTQAFQPVLRTSKSPRSEWARGNSHRLQMSSSRPALKAWRPTVSGYLKYLEL